jgi:hypothetical protein
VCAHVCIIQPSINTEAPQGAGLATNIFFISPLPLKVTGCHSVLQRMIIQEIDGGVGSCRLMVKANIKVGWVSGYGEV